MTLDISFARETTVFGLLENDYVFCIPADQKLYVPDQKNLINMLGCEIVKVHAEYHFKLIKEISRQSVDGSTVDENVVNRRGAFKGAKVPQTNAPIKVKFTENITTEKTYTTKTMILVNSAGKMWDIPENLPSDEKITLAKLVKAEILLGEFQVNFKLLEKASPHRSQAKI